MTAREFFYLVASMRAAQNSYFRERSPEKLRAARALEGDVDREIRRVKDIVEQKSRKEVGNENPEGNQCKD